MDLRGRYSLTAISCRSESALRKDISKVLSRCCLQAKAARRIRIVFYSWCILEVYEECDATNNITIYHINTSTFHTNADKICGRILVSRRRRYSRQ